MSSKLASQTTGGRRTPLSLGPASGQKSNQKLNAESNPPDSTTIDLRNRKSDDKSPNLEKTDSPAKISSAKETTNNSTENKKEKTSKKDSINSQENGHDDEKQNNKDEKQNNKDEKQSNKDEKTNSQKDENPKKADKKIPRDSPRNKDGLKTDAKENNKETEKTKTTDKEKGRATPIEKKEKKDQSDLKKTPVEEIVLPKRSSRATTLAQQVAKQETVTLNVTTDSLKQQADLHGFGESLGNDVEMESLLLDVDVSESATTIPTAAKTSAHSPSLRSSARKATNDEIKEKQPSLIPRRSARKETPLKSPEKLPAVDVPVTSTPDGSTFYSLPPTSLRQISGRRSLRPLKEYTFQYNSNYRESYRRINTEFDCTNNTSMNVTVGSESAPQSESFISSFFSFGRGKKRTHTPPPTVSTTDEIQDDAVNTNTASPKRPRLDLSGLIGIVTSPVTMLKNRIYRGKVDSSTPNNKTEDLEDAEVDEDGVENVSEIISEEKKIILEEEDSKNENDNDNEDATIDLDDEEESNESIEKEKSVEHLNKVEIGDEVMSGLNEGNNEEVVNSNRRGRCHIM
ncbi:probable replication factor C subunit 1 [Condylostylus longicornis]|uniref:probable replication factor C subunit 1 n=1 Tax=Condylostylus longicornis TaxID=2530218 RepID=UPI00244E2D9E|nr:probable replication factor C subunit 1 [Condylostylus longicornis]